jgi:glutamine phosphoribosylpyrophosphate amidotransferase
VKQVCNNKIADFFTANKREEEAERLLGFDKLSHRSPDNLREIVGTYRSNKKSKFKSV